ncbi:MAG TPA: hypothetical protein VGG39_15205 [Polyangiaceae bacterium]|jgi:hypothetical protein
MTARRSSPAARWARRRRERGAVMFIVAMTLAVLGSVGMYALVAAANEVRTAGNERQNTQTHYLSEYGVLGTAHEIVSSKAQFYLGLMLTQPDTPCVSLPGVPNTAAAMTRACRRLGATELGQAWTGSPITISYGSNTPYTSGVAPGSFGPVPMNGDFFVELTEPTQAQAPARYATDLHFCFIELTATSSGITQPVIPGQPSGVYANEGIEQQRARIMAGPVQCPK